MTQHFQLLPTIAVTLAWIPALLLFIMLLRIDWKQRAATRAIFVLVTVSLVTLSLALGRQFGYPPPEWVRGPLYLLIAGAMWFLLISFAVIQHNGRERDRHKLQAELDREELQR